jgi:hypothetical protein
MTRAVATAVVRYAGRFIAGFQDPICRSTPSLRVIARLAENQARAQDMRRAYVYNQKILARFHRTKGKLGARGEVGIPGHPTPPPSKRS